MTWYGSRPTGNLSQWIHDNRLTGWPWQSFLTHPQTSSMLSLHFCGAWSFLGPLDAGFMWFSSDGIWLAQLFEGWLDGPNQSFATRRWKQRLCGHCYALLDCYSLYIHILYCTVYSKRCTHCYSLYPLLFCLSLPINVRSFWFTRSNWIQASSVAEPQWSLVAEESAIYRAFEIPFGTLSFGFLPDCALCKDTKLNSFWLSTQVACPFRRWHWLFALPVWNVLALCNDEPRFRTLEYIICQQSGSVFPHHMTSHYYWTCFVVIQSFHAPSNPCIQADCESTVLLQWHRCIMMHGRDFVTRFQT